MSFHDHLPVSAVKILRSHFGVVTAANAVFPGDDTLDESVKGELEDVSKAGGEEDIGGVGGQSSEIKDGSHVGGYSAETFWVSALQERNGIWIFGVVRGSGDD